MRSFLKMHDIRARAVNITVSMMGLLLVALIFLAKSYDLSFLTNEDGLIEYLSAFLWLIGCVICIFKTVKPKNNSRIIIIIFFFVCLLSFGEEISWGQRLIGFDTPSWCSRINLQNEFNFHNLKALSGGSAWTHFLQTGEFSFYQIFDAQNIFRMGFFFFFFLLPLLNMHSSIQKMTSRIKYESPSLFFLIILWGVIIFSGISEINEPDSQRHVIQEIRELSYAVFVVSYLLVFAPRSHREKEMTDTLTPHHSTHKIGGKTIS